ncbi:MAG: D-alanyl-D-alanine carboxypeptidase, partial [Deltaproteobacteria bacterium]|nr:D-alanyl-D-alanine carboxypeptidase [Deltaproteobacteria bacterium]
VDLTKWTAITYTDAKAGVGGADTVLLEGQTFQNRDLLYAMMLSSDNRVPTALARSVGLGPAELLDKVQHAAADLGLAHTKFADTTGILGNESTAREMALALRETLRDPVLARFMTTRYAKVVSRSEEITANYTSTVQPLWDKRYTIRGGKTGHTEAAGYCLIISVVLGERTVVMAFLGGKTPGARFADFSALAAWLTPAKP